METQKRLRGCAHLRVCACARARVRACACARVRVCACARAHVRQPACVNVRAHVRVRVRVRVRAYAYACPHLEQDEPRDAAGVAVVVDGDSRVATSHDRADRRLVHHLRWAAASAIRQVGR
eukprot:6204993-Pleurochrysis_carterae.AAC.1